jgi:proline iminopeptidase
LAFPDLSNTARELAKAWPGATLHVVEDSGDTGSDTMCAHLRTALNTFAANANPSAA